MDPNGERNRPVRAGALAALAVCAALAPLPGCAHRPAPPAAVTVRWVAGHTAPAFDPDGPPDPLRGALERLLTRPLVERGPDGSVRFAAAETAWADSAGRTWTIRLRAGLRFTDGTPATSADFRDALAGGLAREDHATRAWLLGALTGMDRVRAGRPLPALGIASPDPRTLVLTLARPEPGLLERLASPGVGAPWRSRAPGAWTTAVGLGPYRLAAEEPGRMLTFVRADTACALRAAADTVFARFVVGAPRVRTLLRRGTPDLVWPLPPSLLDEPLAAGYAADAREADPPRRLLLVLRADVPPTTQLPARHALVHALNREALLEAVGRRSEGAREWLAGAGPYEDPAFDASQVRDWLARGRLGSSFHVVLAYDADGAGAEVARALQGGWASLGLYAELRPLRGADAAAEPLRAAAAQAQLVEAQAPMPGAAAELATLVMPLRGPAVGSLRTGWRTREFDPWITAGAPAPGPLDAAGAQARLAEERVALPLLGLPWHWVGRAGTAPVVRFTAATGPEFSRP